MGFESLKTHTVSIRSCLQLVSESIDDIIPRRQGPSCLCCHGNCCTLRATCLIRITCPHHHLGYLHHGPDERRSPQSSSLSLPSFLLSFNKGPLSQELCWYGVTCLGTSCFQLTNIHHFEFALSACACGSICELSLVAPVPSLSAQGHGSQNDGGGLSSIWNHQPK